MADVPCSLHPELPGARACPTCLAATCRRCGGPLDYPRLQDARGVCGACWQRRAIRFARPHAAGHPTDGPLARSVCLTLGGLVRQAELRAGSISPDADERLLLACLDGRTVYELGLLLALDVPTLLAMVQTQVDSLLLELVPELDPGLAPELAAFEFAPALGGEHPEAALAPFPAFQLPPPATFKYPARPAVPVAVTDWTRYPRRKRR